MKIGTSAMRIHVAGVVRRLLARGMSWMEIADTLGVSTRTVRRWAAGDSIPTTLTHLRALKALDEGAEAAK